MIPASPDRVVPSATQRVHVWRMVLLARRYWMGASAVLFLNVVLVAANMVGLGLTGLGIDVLRAAVDKSVQVSWPLGWNPLAGSSPLMSIVAIAGLALCLSLLTASLKYLLAIAGARLSQNIVVDLRTQVYDRLQRLSFRFFDQHDSSSLINRVAGDVQAVRGFIDGVLIRVVTVVVSLAIYLWYMLLLNVPLSIACLATTPGLYLGAVWFARTSRDDYLQSSRLGDAMVRQLVENFQGAQVVKGFGQEAAQVEQFASANREIRDQKFGLYWRLSVYQPLMGFLTQLNMLVLLGYGGWLVIHNELPLGTGLFVFANLLQEFAAQIGQITNIANSIQSSLTGAERVFEILDSPIEVESPSVVKKTTTPGTGFVLENVTFGYLPDRPILRDISLSIAAGSTVGITGETGSGKTTLLLLLARFYDPLHGRILFDGVDLKNCDLSAFRRQLGMVFQESFLFSNTVSANIAYGNPGASAAEITQAAKIASASEFVSVLPDQYESMVGEYGANLSGGQKQRLAIARAVLVRPSVLILDDSTAALDPETEHQIQAVLSTQLSGTTKIIVSSRASTLSQSDVIHVLSQGEIVESGTHANLLRTGRVYPQLLARQAEDALIGDSGGAPA